MNDPHELIWISPILSQAETEVLYTWVNLHLNGCGLKSIVSFSKIKVEFMTEPKEALKMHFSVQTLGAPNSVALFKEAIWSELLVGSQPGPKPYAVTLQSEGSLSTAKRLVCFDMDSTLINEEVIDEIARQAGLFEKISEITEAAMQGKLDFKASLKERVKLLKGMSMAQALSIIPSLSLTPGAEKFISGLRFKGAHTAVVSGGFEIILRHFRKMLFLDQAYGNTLVTDDDEILTGEVEDPIVDAEYKRLLVSKMKENYHVPDAQTVTVGDGANDIPMMSAAGVSVSFCGKPKLAAHVNTLIFDRNLLWLNPLI